VDEVYGDKIEKAHVALIKLFEFVLGRKANHSQHTSNISMAKKCRETIFSKLNGKYTKKSNIVELEVLKLTTIIRR